MGNALPENYLDVQRANLALGVVSGDNIQAALTAQGLGLIQEKARKLVGLAQRGGELVAMGSPPTVTAGATNGASTITGSVHIPVPDDRYTILGTSPLLWPTTPPMWIPGHVTLDASPSSQIPNSKKGGQQRALFNTDALEFEVVSRAWTPESYRYRMLVDGQAVAMAPATAPTDYGFTKFGFAAAKPGGRVIQIDGATNFGFGGIRQHPRYTLRKANPPKYRMIVMTDSFGQSGPANDYIGVFSNQMAQRLGVADIWTNGEGGIGYVKTNPSLSGLTARGKITPDIAPYNPDHIVVALAYNDFDLVAATVGAEASLYYRALLDQFPNAIITVIGPWHGPSQIVPQAMHNALKAAAAAQAEYRADNTGRLAYFDTSPSTGVPLLFGTGRVGATTGVGNTDIYTGPDGVHVVSDGNDHLGRATADLVLRHAMALAA